MMKEQKGRSGTTGARIMGIMREEKTHHPSVEVKYRDGLQMRPAGKLNTAPGKPGKYQL
jgi:hypothetical protein